MRWTTHVPLMTPIPLTFPYKEDRYGSECYLFRFACPNINFASIFDTIVFVWHVGVLDDLMMEAADSSEFFLINVCGIASSTNYCYSHPAIWSIWCWFYPEISWQYIYDNKEIRVIIKLSNSDIWQHRLSWICLTRRQNQHQIDHIAGCE
jgi:hypothetical protein